MKKFVNILLSGLLASQLLLGVVGGRAIAAGSNLIANQSVEQANLSGIAPLNWQSSSWGSNSPSFSYSTNGQNGSRSLYLTLSNYVDGDAKWYFDPVSVTPNTTYNYSDYYKSNVSTEVVAEVTSTTGAVSYTWMGTAPASASNWTVAAYPLKTNTDTAKVAVFHLISQNGWLQTDNFNFSLPSAPPTATNGIVNNSVEVASDLNPSMPTGWQTGKWGTNNASFSYPNTGAQNGSRSLKVAMTSYSSGDAKWYFDPVSVTAGKTYTYSDYYIATVPTDVVAQITSSTGATSYIYMGTASASSSWKQASFNVTMPSNAKSATILHVLAAVGSLQTDNFYFVPAAVTPDSGIPNGSLEQVSSATQPTNWYTGGWGTNTAKYTYLNTGYDGTHSVKTEITSYTDGDAKWAHDPVNVTGNGTYLLTDYYQSNVESHVVLQVTKADNTVMYMQLRNAPASTTWKAYSTIVTVPATAKSVVVLHLISKVGYLITDKYSWQTQTVHGFNRAIISLTFDDGTKSIYQNGIPALKSRNLKSTQYITTGLIGTSGYMTVNDLKAMRDGGHELAAHTVTHADLATLSGNQLNNEVITPKTWLQNNVGVTPTNFATPYGSYNDVVLNVIMANYQSHRSVEAGYNSKDNFSKSDLVVQNILNTTTVAEVQGWIAQAQATKTWLILVYHDVDTSNGAYAVTPTILGKQLDAVVASGISTQTVAQALAEVTPQVP